MFQKIIFLITGILLGVVISPASRQTIERKPASAKCTHDADVFRCVQFISNHDGDTITVEIPDVHPLLGHKAKIRMRGIDTAEVSTKNSCEKNAAGKARDLVEKRLKSASSIELRNVGKDKYFRVLADVYVDGKNLSQELIQEKLAYSYDGGKKQAPDWCEIR